MKNLTIPTQEGPGTVVGVNVALSGTLKDQNDIAVYGMVDGEVISDKSVTIGQTAQVKGPVKGMIITIAGTVRGSIEAGEKLEIVATGKVFGSIATKDLVVHSGALLVGKSDMPSNEPTEAGESEPETAPDDSKNSNDAESAEELTPDTEE